MGRFEPRCRVCCSEQRTSLERLLSEGASFRAVAALLGGEIGKDSLRAHLTQHAPQAVRDARQRRGQMLGQRPEDIDHYPAEWLMPLNLPFGAVLALKVVAKLREQTVEALVDRVANELLLQEVGPLRPPPVEEVTAS